MKYYRRAFALLTIVCFLSAISGCIGSKYGSRQKGEAPELMIHPGMAIDTNRLAEQQMAYNGEMSRGGAFFDPTTYGTTAVSMVATGIKDAIDRENKKYQASYEFNITPDRRCHKLVNDTMYFYDKNSRVGPFDYRNMKFTGFTVKRYFGRSKSDTGKLAMRAFFELDTTNLCEISYDGIFRLKLKEFEIHYAKAKMPRGRKKINLDLEVQFLASYITKDGQFFSNAVLGTFTKTINGVELQNKASFMDFEDKPMDGWSFIVPRSYFHTPRGDMWNKGSYSIKVTVKETSKNKFVKKLSGAPTGKFIEATQNGINVKNIMTPAATPKTGGGGKK